MSKLALDILAIQRVEQSDFTKAFGRALAKGFDPFIPGPLEMMLDYDVDFIRDMIHVEFPAIKLWYRFVLDRNMILSDDWSKIDTWFEEVVAVVRKRQIEPDSNVVLGEN